MQEVSTGREKMRTEEGGRRFKFKERETGDEDVVHMKRLRLDGRRESTPGNTNTTRVDLLDPIGGQSSVD